MRRRSTVAARREAGVSLVEVMVALVLLGAVVPLLGPMMLSSVRSANDVRRHADVLDELRLQSAAIARELRSAECIYEPAIAPGASQASGNRLRFSTNTNGVHYEVTYDVVGAELVRTRDGVAGIVGRGLVGGGDVFTHRATPRRSVDLDFVVQLDPGAPLDAVETSIAGRNAWMSLTC